MSGSITSERQRQNNLSNDSEEERKCTRSETSFEMYYKDNGEPYSVEQECKKSIECCRYKQDNLF